jgi:hypothetical protein
MNLGNPRPGGFLGGLLRELSEHRDACPLLEPLLESLSDTETCIPSSQCWSTTLGPCSECLEFVRIGGPGASQRKPT